MYDKELIASAMLYIAHCFDMSHKTAPPRALFVIVFMIFWHLIRQPASR